MVHLNSNKAVRPWFADLMPDGVKDNLPVDNFPVSDKSFYKSDGWPASDVSLLDRFSRDSNVDESLISKIAQRLEVLRANPRDNMSDDEKLLRLKPHWVQTAAELQDYENMVLQYIEKTDSNEPEKVVSVENQDTSTPEVVESKES